MPDNEEGRCNRLSKEKEDKMSNDEFSDIMKSIGIDVSDVGGVVDLHDNIEADIIFEVKKRPYLRLLWIIPLFALIMALFLAVLFLSQNKLVEGPIVGSKYSAYGYSIVPSSYSVNNRDIKVGSKVYIRKGESPFLGPLLREYEMVDVKGVKDLVISVSQDGTKDLRSVPIFDVLYVAAIDEVIPIAKPITDPESEPSTLEDELELRGEVIESVKGKTNQQRQDEEERADTEVDETPNTDPLSGK